MEVYTNASCLGNPGPGGWAAVLIYNGKERELIGGEPLTTRLRMELMGPLKGLKELKEVCDVTLYSGNQNLVRAFSGGLIAKWRRNGWKTTQQKAVPHQELWEAVLEAHRRHRIRWEYAPGHSGHAHNERCEELARGAAAQMKAP
ncbi:MAG: RNase H family protein [Candidatus Xenobia bacterium]